MKKIFKLFLSLTMAFGIFNVINVNAAESNTQSQTFDTQEDAQAWIDSFDTDKYSVESGIVASEVDGVTASIDEEKDPTGRGYSVVVDHNENTGVPTKITITITGGIADLDIDFKELASGTGELVNTVGYMMPGDSDTIEVEIINASGDKYEYVDDSYSYASTDLMKYYWENNEFKVREATEDDILKAFLNSLGDASDLVIKSLKAKYPGVTFSAYEYTYGYRYFDETTATDEEKANATLKSSLTNLNRAANVGNIYKLKPTYYYINRTATYGAEEVTELPEGVTPVTITYKNYSTWYSKGYEYEGKRYVKYQNKYYAAYVNYTYTTKSTTNTPSGKTIVAVSEAPTASEETYVDGNTWYSYTKYCEITQNDNPNYLLNYLTKDYLLNFYNEANGTENTDLVTAWKEYFFKTCWSYTYDKEWSSLDYGVDADSTNTATWSLAGVETNNPYQNSCWGWNEELKLQGKKTVYTATVTLTEKADPEDNKPSNGKKDKTPTNDTKKKSNGVDTSATSDTTLYFAMMAMAGAGLVALSKKNKK